MNAYNNNYSILTQEQILLVHEKTLQLLEEIGSCILSEKGLKILKDAGCDVSDSKRVKIPRELVEKALKKAPNSINIFDRNRNVAMILKTDFCYYGTGCDCPFIIDLETGERRLSKKEDVAKFALFCDALPHIDFVMSSVRANDVPETLGFIHQYEAMVLNTIKPIIASGYGYNDVKTIIDMAATVSGSYGALKEYPFLILYPASLPPLTHPDTEIEKCLLAAEYGLPFTYVSYSALGASSPITMAGAITQANAECLVGLVITQLKYPGAKFIYGGVCSAFDMSHGTFTYGSPEINISAAALTDLSRFYNLPCFSLGGITDSKTLDAQAGLEYALSLYLSTISGASLIHDCGFLDQAMSSSFESILLADEIISMVKHYIKPLEVSNRSIALDVINEVGSSGTYLTHPHTNTNFKANLWFPRFVYRGQYESWKKDGSLDIKDRLKEASKKILNSHQVEELSDSVVREIRDIINRISIS